MVGDRILLAHSVILNISNRDEDFTPEYDKTLSKIFSHNCSQVEPKEYN